MQAGVARETTQGQARGTEYTVDWEMGRPMPPLEPIELPDGPYGAPRAKALDGWRLEAQGGPFCPACVVVALVASSTQAVMRCPGCGGRWAC